MITVANVTEMRECDRVTIEERSVPGILLMETAARAVTRVAIDLLDSDPYGKQVMIFCGKGNNGGDGFAVARHLLSLGAVVQVHLMGRVQDLKGDAKTNADLFRGTIKEKKKSGTFPASDWSNDYCDLIIDALLGTGFKGVVRDDYAVVIKSINEAIPPVIAVDIPSGVEGDTGVVTNVAVRADETVTFGLYKPGILLPPGREYAGNVTVADIGIPVDVVDALNVKTHVVEEFDAAMQLPKRSQTAHKGDVGHVYIIAGSPGLTGAAALAGEASMRTGAGLTVVGVPKSLNPVLEAKLTEVMTKPLPENMDGLLCEDSLLAMSDKLEWADAIAFGPGVGTHNDTGKFLHLLLAEVKKTLIIDADGLNLLADNPKLLTKLPKDTVLTPHPGEFARLTGLSTKEIAEDRIGLVRKYAIEWGVTVLLKGSPTLTALADGMVYINPTGNAGMATGGSGDVLTGVIASLVVQGISCEQVAWVAAYLHGEAGDIAASEYGQAGMIASDIIESLPEAILSLGGQ